MRVDPHVHAQSESTHGGKLIAAEHYRHGVHPKYIHPFGAQVGNDTCAVAAAAATLARQAALEIAAMQVQKDIYRSTVLYIGVSG